MPTVLNLKKNFEIIPVWAVQVETINNMFNTALSSR